MGVIQSLYLHLFAKLCASRLRVEPALHERSFRQVVEAAPNAMVMIGRAGEIVMVNTQAERAFGYTRAELVGQQVELLVPERFRARHPELRQTFFSDPKPRPMGAGRDLYGVRKDGSEFPVEIGLNPIETDEGILVLSAIVDITQRKAADLALRERERRFRQVVEAAPNAMVMIGRAGEIVMVNTQAERAFGYARAELVGQPAEMLVPERFRARHPELRQTFFSDPKPRPMGAGRDLYGVRKDGSEFPVEIALNPIETDGETMVLSAIVDITQRKAADLALRERELARTNRLMHMFELTASIADEVNQPITAVVSSASAGLRWLAAQPPDLESARQSLKRIIQAGDRAGEVTGRIGALVKQAPTRTDRLNVNDVIREALAMAQPELQKNRVKLHNALLSDLPVVLADRVQLQQVLLNLVGNAIEAMTGAGESARELAVISGSGDAAGVFVEVRDSGPGLDQAQLERLFDPFYTTKPEGLGMGLAISRSIIEAHGGRLWAEPNQPSGATFRFTLPVAEETSTEPLPSEA